MDTNLVIHERFLPEACYSYSSAGNKPKLMTGHDGLVEHFFSGADTFPDDKYNLDKCWKLMRDLNYEPEDRLYDLYHGKKLDASTHFMTGRDGTILQLVPLKYRAFHAGRSEFKGRKWCNNFMLSNENVGSLGDDYTEAQYIANAKLCAQMIEDYGFSVDDITGHENVAPGRKFDPGDTFDWDMLRAMIYSIVGRNK